MQWLIFEALLDIYPEVEWDIQRFQRKTRNFWTEMKNQRDHLDSVGQHFNVRTISDWFKVHRNDIKQKAHPSLLVPYGSTTKMLGSVYPEYAMALKLKFESIRTPLNVVTLNDWYNVKIPHIKEHLGEEFVEHIGANLIGGKNCNVVL
jgi:hypothetical protein